MRDTRAEFTQMYQESYPDVLRFVRRRVPEDVADDVVADVFTVAWRRWTTAPAEIRPWLFGIAHKVIAQDRRARGRRASLQLRIAAQPPHSSGEGHASVDTALDLQAAWAQLSDKDREAIALVAWDGLTGLQAAHVLGCTRAAFAVRLSRARRRLRAAVDANDDRSHHHVPRPTSWAAPTATQISEGVPR